MSCGENLFAKVGDALLMNIFTAFATLVVYLINWIGFDFGKFVSGSLLPSVWNLGATHIKAWRRRWRGVWLSGATNSGSRCCYLAAKTTGNISIKCLFEGVGGHS